MTAKERYISFKERLEADMAASAERLAVLVEEQASAHEIRNEKKRLLAVREVYKSFIEGEGGKYR